MYLVWWTFKALLNLSTKELPRSLRWINANLCWLSCILLVLSLKTTHEKGNADKLLDYCNADYARDKFGRKNTSGSCIFLGKNDLLVKHNTSQQQGVTHNY